MLVVEVVVEDMKPCRMGAWGRRRRTVDGIGQTALNLEAPDKDTQNTEPRERENWDCIIGLSWVTVITLGGNFEGPHRSV